MPDPTFFLSRRDSIASSRSSSSRPRTPLPRIKNFLSLHPRTQDDALVVKSPMQALPENVILMIGQRLTSPCDILNLSLSCHRTRSLIIPRLYSSVILKTNKQCKATLGALVKQPEISRHIRSLVVQPNNLERTAPGEIMKEAIVCDLIIQIAGHLKSLCFFSWEGMEMPNDQLWVHLHTRPLLEGISTTVGERPLQSDSHLYDFTGLKSFSLIVKRRCFDNLSAGRPPVEKLPRRLWEMLIERSPRLEQLTIGGPAPSPRLFDVRHVFSGQWPRLRSLDLGDLAFQTDPKADRCFSHEYNQFMAFLPAHPRLESLALQHASTKKFPTLFNLRPSALPVLRRFSGPLQYVKTLPHPKLLKHLSLTNLHHSVSSFPPTCGVLKGLPSLVSLDIWIDLSFGNPNALHDNGHMFRSLLTSCPHLRHLDMLCFTSPTFHTDDFIQELHHAPNLRSFVFTKIYKSNEEDMIHTATRVAQNNSNIQKFTLRYRAGSWLTEDGNRTKHAGTFEVIRDGCGSPVRLLAHEWGVRTFGHQYSRRFSQALDVPARGRSSIGRNSRRSSSWSSRSSSIYR